MSKKPFTIGSLHDLLLRTIDETFRQVFLDEGAKVIYDYLEDNLYLRREAITEKPGIFSAGLERLLDTGAIPISILIIKNLYQELNVEFKQKDDYAFADYIKDLEHSLLDKKARLHQVEYSHG